MKTNKKESEKVNQNLKNILLLLELFEQETDEKIKQKEKKSFFKITKEKRYNKKMKCNKKNNKNCLIDDNTIQESEGAVGGLVQMKFKMKTNFLFIKK